MKSDRASAVAAANDVEQSAQTRRVPTQKRSQERVERILDVSKEIIAEAGSDTMRMSEVAARAGISIGSLYQYFPDKASIIRVLAERYNDVCYAYIAEGLAGVESIADLTGAFAALFDLYYQVFLDEPAMRDIWSGTQADKALRAIDLDNCHRNGELLAAAITRVKPGVDAARVEHVSFLIMHLGDAAMRLAISVERPEGDRLVEAFKAMAIREIVAI